MSHNTASVLPINCQPPGDVRGYTPENSPARPTAPAGTSARGVARRGTASRGSPPVRYPKPGANPVNATRHGVPVWAAITPSRPRPVSLATSARSAPS